MKFELEVPIKMIGDSNEMDATYLSITEYLERAMDIGESGKWNEERAMLLKLIEVDPFQPAAYNDLFARCSELAGRSAKHPEKYAELSIEAFQHLTTGLGIVLSKMFCQIDNAPASTTNGTLEKLFIHLIHMKAVPFMDECMRGVTGAGNKMLEEIETCLIKCSKLLEKRKEKANGAYDVYMTLGFCRCIVMVTHQMAVYSNASTF
jgi:hypothetical protein